MTKFFTVLITALAFYSLASAQDNKVEFGANIGYNTSFVRESNSSLTANSVSGFNVGVFADFYFSDQWSLKVKAIYDQKGWADGFVTDINGNEVDHANFKLDYITVPVMANWHFMHSRNWYLEAGPYIGFLAKATAAGYDVKSGVNSIDGGVSLGVGVKLPISQKTKFFIECEGQGGVTNAFQNASDGSNVQTVRGSLNVGIIF